MEYDCRNIQGHSIELVDRYGRSLTPNQSRGTRASKETRSRSERVCEMQS